MVRSAGSERCLHKRSAHPAYSAELESRTQDMSLGSCLMAFEKKKRGKKKIAEVAELAGADLA